MWISLEALVPERGPVALVDEAVLDPAAYTRASDAAAAATAWFMDRLLHSDAYRLG